MISTAAVNAAAAATAAVSLPAVSAAEFPMLALRPYRDTHMVRDLLVTMVLN